jgi:hypothetical protein
MIISTAEREELKVALDQELGRIAGLTVKLANNCEPISVAERRRGRTTTANNEGVTLSLLADPNGVLLWEDTLIRPRRGPGLRRGRPGEFLTGDPVAELVVPPMAPNQVAQALDKADKMLTPNQGGTSLAAPAEIKKILSWLSNVNRAISKTANVGATLASDRKGSVSNS